MERLTYKSWRNLDPWECCGQDKFCTRGCHDLGGCIHGCIVPKLYNRLAAYEDTGLEPEEVAELTSPEVVEVARLFAELVNKGNAQRVVELAQADREGRVVALPCKVGDTVWVVNHHQGRIYENTVADLVVGFDSDNRNHIETVYIGKCGSRTYRKWKFQQVGKTVFMTCEEAEQALKEAERND